MSELSARHERFCREYVIDLNATQAYIRAGYKSSGANAKASRLLANDSISSRVRELQDEINEKLHLSAVETIKNVSLMANFDIIDFYNNDLTIKPLDELRLEVRACIVGVETISLQVSKFEYQKIEVYKLADKVKNNDMMMKHHGLYKEKIEISGELNIADFAKQFHDKKIKNS